MLKQNPNFYFIHLLTTTLKGRERQLLVFFYQHNPAAKIRPYHKKNRNLFKHENSHLSEKGKQNVSNSVLIIRKQKMAVQVKLHRNEIFTLGCFNKMLTI